MADYWDFVDFEAYEALTQIERRPVLIDPYRPLDLDVLDEVDFKSRYRFNKATVETIVDLLEPVIGSHTNRVGAVKGIEKVCCALRFFAEGCYQTTIGDLSRFSQPSSCRAINSVAKCLAAMAPSTIKFPSLEECPEISQRFYAYSRFPGVIGTLDCTHVPIRNPGRTQGELFRNRKGVFSLNIQTLSDDKLRIRNIVARWPGGTHDSTIFDNSYLRTVLETTVSSSSHVLGDSGYPLRPYLMTPFLSPQSSGEMSYNSAHILARNSVERQYGVWKSRFACLSHRMRGSIPNTLNIIMATAVLHNIAADLGDVYVGDYDPEDPDPPSNPSSVVAIAKRNALVQRCFS